MSSETGVVLPDRIRWSKVELPAGADVVQFEASGEGWVSRIWNVEGDPEWHALVLFIGEMDPWRWTGMGLSHSKCWVRRMIRRRRFDLAREPQV